MKKVILTQYENVKKKKYGDFTADSSLLQIFMSLKGITFQF